MTEQSLLFVLGVVVVGTPLLRARRIHQARADQAEHASFMAFIERMRQAGEEQENDPRIGAIVARYGHLTGQGRTRAGRHRAPSTAGRHRLQNA